MAYMASMAVATVYQQQQQPVAEGAASSSSFYPFCIERLARLPNA